jgi:sortase A
MPLSATGSRAMRRLRRAARWTLLTLGGLVLALWIGYALLIGTLAWMESAAPSAARVLVLKDGRRIPLVQPTPQAAGAGLPPERLRIASIGLDWPVVLADNTNVPRFKGVGWLQGSAYPGQPGNLVLFGHLDGPYSTFARLRELQPGDILQVGTLADTRRYRVRTSRETTPDDVGVLAPTVTATATLITCSGLWNALLGTYDQRLIITADYVGLQ